MAIVYMTTRGTVMWNEAPSKDRVDNPRCPRRASSGPTTESKEDNNASWRKQRVSKRAFKARDRSRKATAAVLLVVAACARAQS